MALPRITKRRVKNKLLQWFPQFGRLKDDPLDRIKCIRHTITWRCNYKCTSCDIWKIEKPRWSGQPSRVDEEVTPEQIERMCKSPLLSDVSEVIISGGEPTIRNDFVELILAYRNLRKARFGITINGYDPHRAHTFFRKIKEQWPGIDWSVIGVSLNGRRETHNRSRGVKCYDQVLETAKALQEFSGNVAFSFTFLEDNVDEFQFVQELGQSLGINTHVCWTVMNERFVAKKKDLVFRSNPSLIPVLERYVDTAKVKETDSISKDFIRYRQNIKGAYLYDSILNHRVMPCHAAQTFFHLGPYGDVYPCNFDLRKERILGNIKDDRVHEILSRVTSALLGEIKRGECMYPKGELCGDSDINRSIGQIDSKPYDWYEHKREIGENLIAIDSIV